MINAATLLALSPRIGTKANDWADALASWLPMFDLATPRRQAMFIAQCLAESAGFTVLVENLDYSADGLVRVFGKYFNQYDSLAYAHHADKIANRVYANRMGNGGENTGEGWRYRGRGIFQITGHDNYLACGLAIGADIVTHPDQLIEPDYAIASAIWYWTDRGLNQYADAADLDGCSDLINIGHKTSAVGDAHGYSMRKTYYDRALELLA